uniref:Uncharacterized protein n=1 Tax=Zooxanthella nutricula TaxID=1333877 RepID=A0A7S2NT12_9DINO
MAVAAAGCGGVGQPACMAQDDALLQVNTRPRMAAKELTCERCVETFARHGGCEAVAAGDHARIEGIVMSRNLSGCLEQDCETEFNERCPQSATGDDDASGEHAAPHASARDEPCNAACTGAFSEAGGCVALQANNVSDVQALMTSSNMAACQNDSCGDAVFEHCFPAMVGDACGSCVSHFKKNGGCAVVLRAASSQDKTSGDAFVEHLPYGCGTCMEEALMSCMAPQGEDTASEKAADCGACMAALDGSGGCAWVLDPAARNASDIAARVPAACSHIGWACGEEVARHCAESAPAGASGDAPNKAADSAPGATPSGSANLAGGNASAPTASCSTAHEGDQCFMHVRWAMRTGILAHPQWYPGLTVDSSFEDFQACLHKGAHHGCPRPCKSLPHTICHTALPGEVCHRHVRWAMNVGIRTLPAWYPTLTADSSFDDFQAWLHHLHHGDCARPCGPDGM